MNYVLESLTQFFNLLSFRDLIDLLLVWVVIYRLMHITRVAGAYQIIAGISFLGLAYWLSIWAELIAFNWILENFFSNIFIIIVILFQGEIRRALAQFGSNPFFASKSRLFQESHVMEEISKGCFQLAQRGIGAIIIIEKEIELDYFIEKGVEIDSRVTADLITSIFLPDSPLHDGAIVIRGTRIYSAGCFLPLTKNPIIDKNLGSRHRAAIGLTEETDAVAYVISEENKSVGEAKAGKFTPNIDHIELRKRIYLAYNLKYKALDIKKEG